MGNAEAFKKNSSGYPDPTAYAAIRNIDEEEKRKGAFLNGVFALCRLFGFRIEGRIVFKDLKTGRVWR